MKLTTAAEKFLQKTLGLDGFEELEKFELFKLRSNKVLDHEEIRAAMQIVPRAVLSFLHKELAELDPGQSKEIKLPVETESFLHVTKFESDVYTGEIRQKGDVIARFKDRSLPGIGLVVMSAFELYDVSTLPKISLGDPEPSVEKIQSIIDERLGLHSLVGQVVDRHISQREAIDSLIKMRLTQAIRDASEQKDVAVPKNRKLGALLQKKAAKRREFKIEMTKNESVSCPDCRKKIFEKGIYSGCICMGEDRDNKIFIKKNEDGFTMRFPKSWDIDNIQLLLGTLRSKNRGKS